MDVFELNSFSGVFVDPALLEGEQKMRCEDEPTAKVMECVLSPSFEESGLFFKVAFALNGLELFFNVHWDVI